MLVLYNPTNEDMNPQYSGNTYHIHKDGGQVKVEDAAANHIMSRYTDRGLCRLEFGDEGRLQDIAADGIKRWDEFRTRMVIKHNQTNTARAQVGQTYLPPPEHLKRYAADLGLSLDQPFTQKVNEREMELGALQRKNMELEGAVRDLTQKMDALMNALMQGDGGEGGPKSKKK